MYQLVMSLIHDQSSDEQYDADSIVYGIINLGVGLKAAIQYQKKIAEELGVTFAIDVDWAMESDSPVFYSSTADLFSPGRGPATITVQLQRMRGWTAPEEIVEMMRLNGQFTNSPRPA